MWKIYYATSIYHNFPSKLGRLQMINEVSSCYFQTGYDIPHPLSREAVPITDG